MRQANHGVTLLELTVSSGLMALLFFSGLQLLSSLFQAQATLGKVQQETALKNIRLETQMRIMLQDASHLELLERGRGVQFMRNGEESILRFKAQPPKQLQLVLNKKVLAEWPLSQHSFGFVHSSPRLLNVNLPLASEPVQIWLRNTP